MRNVVVHQSHQDISSISPVLKRKPSGYYLDIMVIININKVNIITQISNYMSGTNENVSFEGSMDEEMFESWFSVKYR